MNKKFLAIAVAAAMVPAAASADVKVYGKANVEYSVVDNDGEDSQTNVNDDGGTSRLGFKFTEKLGGGLTAFGVFEFGLDPADKDQNFSGRQQYVGLKSSWGAVTAGALPNIYGATGGAKFDPFNATNIQLRSAGGMSSARTLVGHHDFNENSIGYTSPKVNGFQASIQLMPDEAGTGGASGEKADNDWVVALNYKNGPWTAGIAHAHNNNDTVKTGTTKQYLQSDGTISTVKSNVLLGEFGGTNTSIDDEKATKVALQWKSGAHTISGQYEWLSDARLNAEGGSPNNVAGGAKELSAINTGEDGEIWFINYDYKFGNNIVSVAYGETESDAETGGKGNETDVWRVGMIHKFSKQTRIFGGYVDSDTNEDSTGDTATVDRDAWTVGIRKDF
jgi:predicted porin